MKVVPKVKTVLKRTSAILPARRALSAFTHALATLVKPRPPKDALVILASALLLMVGPALANDDNHEVDNHEVKVYGVITYLSKDLRELRLDNLPVSLASTRIEGFLALGVLVEVEGSWQNGILLASELEVRSGGQDLIILRGQVIGGELLGYRVAGLTDGRWLELTARQRGGELEVLLARELPTPESGLQGRVERITKDGFIAAGVTVVSPQAVTVGERVFIKGRWDGAALRSGK